MIKDFNIINLNDLTWQLNVAILGGVFAVFSLIYNEHYIYYGLITFVFGVISHIAYKFFEWIFRESGTNNKYYWLTHLCNAGLAAVWIGVLVCFYS